MPNFRTLSNRFEDIERWMIPLLLLMVLVVGFIRMMPWLESKLDLFLGGKQAQTLQGVSPNNGQPTVHIDTQLAPVITDRHVPLSEARSEQLTSFLSDLNETPNIDMALETQDGILTQDVSLPNLNPATLAEIDPTLDSSLDLTETVASNTIGINNNNLAMESNTAQAVNDELTDQAKLAIESSIMRWANAWQAQNTAQYIEAYVPGYATARHPETEQWQQWRISRILRPQHIELEIENLEILLAPDSNGSAVATFVQHYRADTYADKVIKVLELIPSGETWLITQEKTLETL